MTSLPSLRLPGLQREPLDWEQLIRRLVATALRLGASVEEAEDLVQDTLEVVCADPGWFDRSRGSLITALTTVLRNRFIDRRRHDQVHRRATPHLRLLEPPSATPDQAVAAAEARARRKLFLAQLTQEERALFGAWLKQDRRMLQAQEAAASLGMRVSDYDNAKKRLRRRCRWILLQLEIETHDLFGPEGGAR
ncbi:MAG: hypothetical protein KTR31_38185 [Myxococcales bacterium]|nr:hypothetical protein [Myxococcales bacterium]